MGQNQKSTRWNCWENIYLRKRHSLSRQIPLALFPTCTMDSVEQNIQLVLMRTCSHMPRSVEHDAGRSLCPWWTVRASSLASGLFLWGCCSIGKTTPPSVKPLLLGFCYKHLSHTFHHKKVISNWHKNSDFVIHFLIQQILQSMHL